MGAWGYGYFEDDSALDFLYELEESDNPKQILSSAFDAAKEADYLEYDESCAVIVAAAYVDSQINGTKFSSLEDEEPLEVDTFPERHPGLDLADLKLKAVSALRKVITDNSELNELWAENEEDYPLWKQGVEQLIERLHK